jgi:hypothetical protein
MSFLRGLNSHVLVAAPFRLLNTLTEDVPVNGGHSIGDRNGDSLNYGRGVGEQSNQFFLPTGLCNHGFICESANLCVDLINPSFV